MYKVYFLLTVVFLVSSALNTVISTNDQKIVKTADGSDEAGSPTTEPAVVTTVTPPIKPPIIPTTGCLLPQHPQHGRYQLLSGGNYEVNAIAASLTFINITCDEGYTSSSQSFALCNRKHWDPDLPYCIRKDTCESVLQSETYDTQCTLEGRTVSCENPLEDTIVRVTCKPNCYYPASTPILKCTNGYWNPSVQPCIPECGLKTVNAETLGISGSNALKGEYPWMVAIYNTSSSKKDRICGGSIISRVFVLSAAHCFADSKGVVHDKNLFTVAAGKYYRDFNIAEPGSQIRKIERLFVHEYYKGLLTKYSYDIALIEVEKFEITLQVQVVCIDWTSMDEEEDLKEGNTAVVAGWGFTTEGATPSEVLKKLIVPFRSTDTCRQYMEPDFFQRYYSSDKICAGFRDQDTTTTGSVCRYDSGGGLFFRSKLGKFVIRALVSLAPRSQTGCYSNHFVLFTKLSRYLSWLETVTRRRS